MSPDDALLVEAVVDDRLEPAQRARLRERLEDPAFLVALGRALELVGALRAGSDARRRQAELQRAVGRLVQTPAGEPFTDRVMQRLRRRSRGRSRRIRRPRRIRLGGLALAALGAVAVLVLGGLGVVAALHESAVVPTRVGSTRAVISQPVLWRVVSDQAALIIGSDGASRFGRALIEGDELRAQAELRLRRGDGSEVELDPATVLRVRDGTSLQLASGRIRARVTPQTGRHPFMIHTAHARVTVVGTIFSVEAQPLRSIIAVSEGRVLVSAEGYQRSLGSAERLELPGPPQSITNLALVEAPGGSVLRGYERISDGHELLLRELPSDVNFVVGVSDEIVALRTVLRDDAGRELGGSVELDTPFTVFGDDGAGNLARWHLQPGRYRLRIEAYTDAAASGQPREVVVQRFEVSTR